MLLIFWPNYYFCALGNLRWLKEIEKDEVRLLGGGVGKEGY